MKQNKKVVESYILDEKSMAKESLTKVERAITKIVFFLIVYTILMIVWQLLEIFIDGAIAKSTVDTVIASVFSCHFVMSHQTEAYKWVLKHIKKEC